MPITPMTSVCMFCGTPVPAGVQPEVFLCCGEVGRTEDVKDDSEPENQESVYYAELERGFSQDRI